MLYCQEFVILQSALKLIEKKVGEDKVTYLDGQSASDSLHILTTAIGEVGQGLEQENDPEEQLLLEQKLHDLIFLKLLLTHYDAEKNEVSPGLDLPNFEPTGPDSMEAFPKPRMYASQIILCGLLPPISKALYFKAVLAHEWQGHLHELLHNVDEEYALSVLRDIHNQIQDGDWEWSTFLMDFIMTQIVTVSEAGRPTWSLESMTEMADLLQNLILTISQNEDETVHITSNICAILFLTIICYANFDTEDLLKWFRSSTKGNKESDSPFPIIQSYFLDFGRKEDIFEHGKMSLDLNLQMLSVIKANVSFMNTIVWCINSSQHNKEDWRLLMNSTADQSRNEPFKKLCAAVVSVMKNSCCQPNILNVEISVKSVTTTFAKLIRKFVLDNESHERKLTSEQKEILVQILEAISVPDIVKEVGEDSSILSMELWEDSPMQTAIWRIYSRQPGFQDGLSSVLQCQRKEIWDMEEVLECMECNKDLLRGDNSVKSLLDLTVWAYREGLTHSKRIKQLVLETFDSITVTDRSGHIADVYEKYRFWPDQQNDMDQRINTVLNRLTNQKDSQVHLEVHHIALQDMETLVCRSLERAHTSKDQAEIIANIFLSLPDVCRVRKGHTDNDSQSLFNISVTKFLRENKLHPKEEKHFLYFISRILQAGTTEEGDQSLDAPLLLFPSDLLVQLVFPYVGLSHLRNNQSGMTISFALDVGVVALETVLEQHCLSSSSSSVQLIMQKICSLDYRPFVLNLAELLHKCLILWRGTDEEISYIVLKEKTVRLLDILRKVTTDLNLEIKTCHWLNEHLLHCDWTVQVFINHLLTTSENYEKVCYNLLRKILGEKDGLSLLCNVLRFAAVNDFTSTMLSDSENLPTEIKYEELQLCLIQLLPNMTSPEWLRVVDLIWVLLEKGHLIVTPTMSSPQLPLVNLESLKLPLSLSLVLHDTVSMLQMSGVDPFLPAVNHCLRMYVSVLKNKVIPQCEEVPSECHVLLYLEVYLHVVRATSWIPTEIQDVTNVLLLDLISHTDELLKNITGDVRCLLTQNLTQLVDITSQFIQDDHTRNMILKITEANNEN